MKLTIIGSGSAGNSYLLHNQTEALIIEAGMRYAEVKKAIDFDVSKIVGLLVSHCHADHAGYLKQYAHEGVKVFTSRETALHYGIHNLAEIVSGKAFKVGGFKVMPFDVVHDVKTHGFLIEHSETGKFCFITDTHYSPFKFKGLDNIIIEANYSERIIGDRLMSGKINKSLHDRVINSHMSLETAIGFLKANDLTNVRNIVLIHLSDGNSDETLFKKKVEAGCGIPTHIATAGMTIEFNKNPF